MRFAMNKVERDISSRVIVVDVRGTKIGLSVDAVSEVLRVESERIEAAPALVSGMDASSLAGVVKVNEGKKLVMILDASSLCSIGSGKAGGESALQRGAREQNTRDNDRKIEEVQLVSFLLGNEEFALEIENVREIIRYPEVVKVPNMPHYVKGVISLRDNLMPIIDMRLKLNTGSDEITDSTRVIVIDVDNTRIGLVVDRVYEVARIPKDTIFPPPQALNVDTSERLQGIARVDGGKRIIMLIDPMSIMTREELQDIGSLDSADSSVIDEENDYTDQIDEEQMVVFKLAGEQFGVRIIQVQEINRLSKITKVPRAPRFVEGVINLRGDVIPLIDLRKRFEIESKEHNEFTRVIVSDINNKKIGIIVDEVLEVLRIPANLLEQAPDIVQENEMQSFMDGIAKLEKRMIMLLNLENVLVEKEWQKLESLSMGQTSQDETPKNQVKSKEEKPKLKKQGRSERV